MVLILIHCIRGPGNVYIYFSGIDKPNWPIEVKAILGKHAKEFTNFYPKTWIWSKILTCMEIKFFIEYVNFNTG